MHINPDTRKNKWQNAVKRISKAKAPRKEARCDTARKHMTIVDERETRSDIDPGR